MDVDWQPHNKERKSATALRMVTLTTVCLYILCTTSSTAS
jgi:hypothetical protein